jgi:hypothetical protein
MPEPELFTDFIARTATAQPEQYAEACRAAAARWGMSVERVAAEFARMKAHVLSHYVGVQPNHSFVNAAGQTVDCIPFEQQPAVRAARRAGLPVMPRAATATPAEDASPVPQSRPEAICDADSVPLLRLTLEHLISLGTLDNYFRKTPGPPPHQ